MTGAGEDMANGCWCWIEDEDVGVVREGEGVSEGVFVRQGVRVRRKARDRQRWKVRGG